MKLKLEGGLKAKSFMLLPLMVFTWRTSRLEFAFGWIFWLVVFEHEEK